MPRTSVAAFCAVVLLCSTQLLAQTQTSKQPATTGTTTTGTDKPADDKTKAQLPTEQTYLKITIEPSRSPIALDTAAGLAAEVKNVSTVPISIYEKQTVFVTVPELHIYGQSASKAVGCAMFPTQEDVDPKVTNTHPERGRILVMQAGESYRVFWDMTVNGCTGERETKIRIWADPLAWAEDKWQRIAFKPGSYRVYMDVIAYLDGDKPYHTSTETKDTQVSASQQIVLLGAFIGGLLAYVLKRYYGVDTQIVLKDSQTWFAQLLPYTEWFVAGVFGAGMSILASRLSDTFPVKVSADDFWGAVTLGFVFQWIGVKLLEKLPGLGPSKNPNPPPNPPPNQAPNQASGA